MATLTANAVNTIVKEGLPESVTLKVTNLRPTGNPVGSKWQCSCTDGSGRSMDGVLTAQIAKAMASGKLNLAEGDIVEVTNGVCNNVGNSYKLMITSMSVVVSSGAPPATAEATVLQQTVKQEVSEQPQQMTPPKSDVGKVKPDPMEEDAKENQPASTPVAAKRESPLPAEAVAAAAAVVQASGSAAAAAAASSGGPSASCNPLSPGAPPPVPNNTPLAAARPPAHPSQGTPGTAAAAAAGAAGTPAGARLPGDGPSSSGGGGFLKTPGSAGSFLSAGASPGGGGFTPGAPPMPTPVAESKPNVAPIAALNPYDTMWTIKAKVTHKDVLRSFNKGSGGSVFSAELADAHGGQIKATFWRQAADKFYPQLEEGKVYYFSRFSVKPANRSFSNIRNDYEAHFDGRSEVEQAADQSGIVITTPVHLVPLNQLQAHVGRKALVDVAGVVVEWGSLGSVKRKNDGTDLARRDVTLGDSSGLSVVLTLWGQNAVGLEAAAGQVLQATCLRVSDYNGCSLTTVSRSIVTIDPESPECATLASWWAADGASTTFTPLGQPGARSGGGGGGGGGGGQQQEVQLLGQLIPDECPADDKPLYGSVVAAVAKVSDTNMYYLADPATGRKVVAQDGRYWSESEQKYVEVAQHRYSLQVQIMDGSRSAYVTMFDQQAEMVVGHKADELAALVTEGKDAAVANLLKAAQWREWELRVRVKPHEYNGERKTRCQVVNVRPLDYQADSKRLLQLLGSSA